MDSPKLGMESCGGLTVTKGGVTYERYRSLQHCSQCRNIPFKILSLASNSKPKPPGLLTNGKIQWENFQPWLAQNYQGLLHQAALDGDTTDEDDLETAIKREDLKTKRYKNRALERKYILRQVPVQALTELQQAITKALAEAKNELAYKVTGENDLQKNQAHIEEYHDKIIHALKTPLHQWKTYSDLPTEIAEND